MTQPVQIDPLNSPFPIPWNWILATLSDRQARLQQRHFFRTQSLISPNGDYAAYSRIQIRLAADFTRSQVSSALFVENLQTGDFHTLSIGTPFADNPFIRDEDLKRGGTIAIAIPVAWSEESDRLLVREFESIFGTSIASDFAIIWDRTRHTSHILAPSGISYSNAILLGWSQTQPHLPLFRAGMMGDPDWPQWIVQPDGTTTLAPHDSPLTFGHALNHVWAGPQTVKQGA